MHRSVLFGGYLPRMIAVARLRQSPSIRNVFRKDSRLPGGSRTVLHGQLLVRPGRPLPAARAALLDEARDTQGSGGPSAVLAAAGLEKSPSSLPLPDPPV